MCAAAAAGAMAAAAVVLGTGTVLEGIQEERVEEAGAKKTQVRVLLHKYVILFASHLFRGRVHQRERLLLNSRRTFSNNRSTSQWR